VYKFAAVFVENNAEPGTVSTHGIERTSSSFRSASEFAAMLQAEYWARLKHPGHYQRGDGCRDHDLQQREGWLGRTSVSGACLFVNLHGPAHQRTQVVQEDDLV
jgi:hypothetical protein